MTTKTNAPFIWIEMQGGAPVCRGDASWRSGREIAGPIGRLFAAWQWDGAQLEAEVDSHGFHSLFVYEKDGVIAIAPNLLTLVEAGADSTHDQRALAVFHRIGVFINDDTPLKHIRTLPPAGRLIWQAGQATITGGVPIPKAQSITRKDAVEGMTQFFRQAMTRVLDASDDPVTLPLSGGRDSRHILLEMLHQGRAPRQCVTFHHNGAKMNNEALAARAVAARAGVAHDVLGYPRPRLADALRCTIQTGLCADEHAQMMPLHDYVARESGTAMDGIAGDILTNPDNDAEAFFALAEKGDFTGIARGLTEGHARVISQPGWGRGAGPILSPDMDEEVHDYLGRAIAQYADAPDPYQMFWMYHRTRREINFVSQSILSGADQVLCPYLDPDFAEFCLSLPYSVTRDQLLHDDVIAGAYPDYADIPYAAGFAAPSARGGGMAHKLRSGVDMLRITAALGPKAVAQRRDFLRPPAQLKRMPDTALRLHTLCLDGLTTGRARRLREIAERLEAAQPRRLVSERMDGRPA
ncbi:asparagine synthase-related protein [Roseovarius nanhaiticus]|uniref:asparagine synthase-related protein n=1 Tax=Roseovarius nanhaiticus TaxID=573024 RepID=UPI00248FA1EE|nr:asparagine synthase-related protein [Roseovarius nanhaiticus]